MRINTRTASGIKFLGWSVYVVCDTTDHVLYNGNKADAMAYYRRHDGARAGLTIGERYENAQDDRPRGAVLCQRCRCPVALCACRPVDAGELLTIDEQVTA